MDRDNERLGGFNRKKSVLKLEILDGGVFPLHPIIGPLTGEKYPLAVSQLD